MKQVFKGHRLCKPGGPLGPYIDSYEAATMKEEILAKTTPLGGKPGRHRAW